MKPAKKPVPHNFSHSEREVLQAIARRLADELRKEAKRGGKQ